MRKLLGLIAVAALVVGVAGVAQAAPLKWSGTMKIELGEFPDTFLTGTSVSTLNGSAGGSHLSSIFISGGFIGSETVPVTDPDTTMDNGILGIIVDIQAVGPGTLGNISGGGALSPSVLAVGGLAQLCIGAPPNPGPPATCPGSALPLPLINTAFTAGVGIGGLLTIGGTGDIRISIVANPWTLGQGSAIDQTDNGALVTVYSTGFAHGPASGTSSTATRSGVVKFITPLQVTTNLTAGSAEVLSLFATMKLHFVPEPGMLLLLGSGVVGLVLLGRHRMKK